MHVKDKILLDRIGLEEHGPINIVIFGDSISHGAIVDIDYENVYWNVLKRKLNAYRSYMPVNMINASIGGTNAMNSVKRMERDVFSHNPDLVIICFGLNDVNLEFEQYVGPLEKIFARCKEFGCDAIFMSPNMLNTYVADDAPAEYWEYAHKTADTQNNGRMDKYMYAAMDLARKMGITVCDCYSKWKELSKTQDITMLLANRINHPNAEMHKLFADSLYEVIMGQAETAQENDSTMVQQK